MQPIVIPCPHCGAQLKLRNPALLGRVGKCPQCKSRFPLAEPAAVELELADPPSKPTENPAQASPPPEESEPEINIVVAEDSVSPALRAVRKPSSRGPWVYAVGLFAVLAVMSGVIWSIYRLPPQDTDAVAQAGAPHQDSPSPASGNSAQKAQLIAQLPPLEAGPPLDLKYVPHGAGMVVHFRAAAFQASTQQASMLRDCLGTQLESWLADQVPRHCLYELSEIESVKFCLYFGAPGEPIEIAGVVKLAAAPDRIELIKKFAGERKVDLERPYYVGEQTAYLLVDPQTFAFCPSSLVADWQDTVAGSAVSRENLLRILKKSDQRDDVTVIFDVEDLRLHGESLFPKDVLTLTEASLDQLGDDVATVCWGVRFEPAFRSRVTMRARTGFEQRQQQRQVTNRLQKLPDEVLQVVKATNPAHLGAKRLIGRLPAMALVAERSSTIQSDGEYTSLETMLPAIAGPNLALATRLAWSESVRGASNGPAVLAAPRQQPQPKNQTIVEKLAKTIECDFRRVPLHEAIDYIAEETGVKLELLGDDLKMIGVTQNLPQEFQMRAAATAVLDRMLTKEGLVVVINEEKKLAQVTSAKAAQERGETPLMLTNGTAP